MKLDLSILRATPEYSVTGLLSIEALAPLSMVAKMPGKYYRSQPGPTNGMLLAMLENALGWHISVKERDALLKVLSKRHKNPAERSGVGFGSVLQWHVRIANRSIPDSIHYDDLWAQHLKAQDERHTKGSRNHDSRIIGTLNEANMNWTDIDVKAIRSYFPQYYVSPTPREYIVPDGTFRFRVETSPDLAELLANAITDPAAPLYLGSNEGWVDAKWEEV
jgi:CRISPR-associated protein Cas5